MFLLVMNEVISDELPEILICDLCNTVYINENELNCHKRLCHEDTASLRKQICLKCGKNLCSKSALYRHMRAVHKDTIRVRRPLKTIACNYDGCNMRFCSKTSLCRHLRTVHTREELTEFICAICGHCSFSKTSLSRHINSLHTFKRNDDPSALQTIVPEGHMYKVNEFELLDEKRQTFAVKFTFEVETMEAGLQWFERFKEHNNLYLKRSFCRHSKKENIIFKTKYVCRHNVATGKTKPKYSQRKFSKQTFCPWRCLFQISKMKEKKSSEQNPFILVKVRLKHAHNHDTKFSKQFLPPTQEVKDAFLELFQSGFTPGEALKIYLRELENKFEDRFSEVCENSSIVPKKQWVYRFYHSTIVAPKKNIVVEKK